MRHFALIAILTLASAGGLVGTEPEAGQSPDVANLPKAPRYYWPLPARHPASIRTDVAVYGGTPAGVAAAVQAARMGRKATLLSFNRHVGGMTSGGLTATDIGNRDAIGGLTMEFYKRLHTMSGFRPSEAEALFLTLLKEAGVEVLLERRLASVTMREGRLVSAVMETGEAVEAAVFVDATYEGDLMAAANVSYQVGREPAGAYGEAAAGLWQKVSWKDVYQFCGLPIDPFVREGNQASGLLPGISGELPGEPGQGDLKVQAYNFRMFLTDKPGRIPFPKPAGYDAARYALLARFLNADLGIKWVLNYTTAPMTDGPVQLRDGDSNNAGSFSTDHVGGNYQWPDGTYRAGSWPDLLPARRGLAMPLHELYELRERIFQDHIAYQQGLMFFLANDPRVPAELRAKVNRFGLDPREFAETGYWPHQLYIREARRMVSDYVMTQNDCESKTTVSDPVGLASYHMDSHFCQRVVVVENGRKVVRNEGGMGLRCPRPYPVSYRSIVPKRQECTNLIVPVCLSASHIAYGSIRMEPVFMILGQSAGTAAVLAIEKKCAVQDLPYADLRVQLNKAGQVLGDGRVTSGK